MKQTRIRKLLVLACVMASLAASAQSNTATDVPAPPPAAPPKFSAAELEKLAVPIAMHPDPLIAILLPASESGIMTFIVNQQGRVYQKNLGPQTAKSAGVMKAYEPDKTWTLSPD